MAKLTRRFTIISLTMALFAFMFAQLVVNNQPGIRHKLGDFTDTPDILDPVGLGKAQVLIEPVPHIVAIKQECVAVHQVQ